MPSVCKDVYRRRHFLKRRKNIPFNLMSSHLILGCCDLCKNHVIISTTMHNFPNFAYASFFLTFLFFFLFFFWNVVQTLKSFIFYVSLYDHSLESYLDVLWDQKHLNTWNHTYFCLCQHKVGKKLQSFHANFC